MFSSGIIYIPLLCLLIMPQVYSQQNENLEKVTGYKEFKFGLTKSAFKNYILKKFDSGYLGYKNEPGIEQYIIENYNGKLGDFDIEELILHFYGQSLVKITLRIDGNVLDVQEFLEYTFGAPVTKTGFSTESNNYNFAIINDSKKSEWIGSKISILHTTNLEWTVPNRTLIHELEFMQNHYDELLERNQVSINDKAFEDLSGTSTGKPTINTQPIDFNIGDKISDIPSYFTHLGTTASDNSKIYRINRNFESTVFSFTVYQFEIKIFENTIVALHFILNPKDSTSRSIPLSLVEQIKTKSGVQYIYKDSKYFFDEGPTRTIVSREDSPIYGGDKIHIMTISTKYLSK